MTTKTALTPDDLPRMPDPAEVWQIYPGESLIRIRKPAGIHDLAGDDLLETPVLPGFQVAVKDIFHAY